MNKLVKIVGYSKYSTFGVLETPCYPCKYYGGVIRIVGREWVNIDNSFVYFKRTIEEAEKSAKNWLETLSPKEDNKNS